MSGAPELAAPAAPAFPPRPAAVICDMDGLLVDSERLERRAWQAVAAARGLSLDDARFATFVGLPSDVGATLFARYYGADFDVADFRAATHAWIREAVAGAGVPLRPGALAWLEFVAAAGIPLAVATSSGPRLLEERLGAHRHRFATMVCRADVARGKPHPDLYLEAARRLGVAPESCLALEDSPTGARAALAAAMPVVVVPDLVAPDAEVAARAAGVYASLDAVRAAATAAWGAAVR